MRHYGAVAPLFITVPTGLSGAGQQIYATTEPLLHDALIFGAMVLMGSSSTPDDNGQNTFLNVGDRKSKL